MSNCRSKPDRIAVATALRAAESRDLGTGYRSAHRTGFVLRRTGGYPLFDDAQLNRIDHGAAHAHVADDHHAIARRS
jgi:hypothetical protein